MSRLPSRYGATPGERHIGDVASDVGMFAKTSGISHAFFVSDAGVAAAGHVERAADCLTAAGVRLTMWLDVASDPTETAVDQATAVAREAGVDGVVALGGGSVMDTAKGVRMLLAHSGRMRDHLGPGSDGTPLLPMVAMPTTAGTGSESQSFALVSRDDDHRKMACGDPHGIPTVSLLDPRLTASAPHRVTALAGMDALVHGLETAVTTAGNEASWALGMKAFVMLRKHLPEVLQRPDDLDARRMMLLGSSLAGEAIEASMLGAAHACANPLTARYGLPHGEMVGLMASHVVRFNGCEAYARMAEAVGVAEDRFADDLQALQESCGLRVRLSDCGVPEGVLRELAEDAATQWTGRFNPVTVSVDGFEALYRAAW